MESTHQDKAYKIFHASTNLIANPQKSMVPTPQQLGMKKTLAFVGVPSGQTFFYKKRVTKDCDGNIQVIQTAHEDSLRFRKMPGPFIYAVADSTDKTCYLGKSLEAFLCRRWIRIKGNIHHKESRDYIISEILAGRGPVWLWSASIEEIRKKLPLKEQSLDSRAIAERIEALWIQRWKSHLWNDKYETVDRNFSDGEYWLSKN
jgi:hypothetical protein